jgi:hypothetical protein
MRKGRAAARVPFGRPNGGARLTIVLVLVIGLVSNGDAYAQQPSGDVSAIERQTLTEFFAATGGERWTNHDGWGTTTPVCNWYGVFCDFADGDASRPFVAGLSLALNNLEGEVPASLGHLARLRSLDVTSNRLSGTVPEPLLRRWDDHQFEFSGERNAFSDVVVRASVEYSASGALCAEHDDLRFRLDLDTVTNRAVLQSVRCADAKSRRTYCFVRQGTPGSFAPFSRELKRLGFARFEPKYDYPFSGVTHGVYLTTTATWGNQSQSSVETYNRQGPREVWIAQQLFLGLLSEASWEKETRKAKCDFEK